MNYRVHFSSIGHQMAQLHKNDLGCVLSWRIQKDLFSEVLLHFSAHTNIHTYIAQPLLLY